MVSVPRSVQFDFELRIASPKAYGPNKNILQWAQKNNGNILLTKDPLKAASSVDCVMTCLLYTSPSPRDATLSRMPSSA